MSHLLYKIKNEKNIYRYRYKIISLEEKINLLKFYNYDINGNLHAWYTIRNKLENYFYDKKKYADPNIYKRKK